MKYLYRIIVLSSIIIPTTAWAAFNDVTLTTNAVIQVGSYTLNISGSSAVIQSIVVSATTVIVTLGSGSSITITSPTRNELPTDTTTGVTATCNSSASSLAITGVTTVTVTPSATLCADAAVVTPPPSGGGGSSGGGSVSRAYLATLLATTTPSIPGCPANLICTPSAFKFSRDLLAGSAGLDVRNLQIFLNTHGFSIVATGAGSRGQEIENFGQLTKLALIKFQTAHSISPTGYFGPLTRALINSLNVSTSTNTNPVTSVTPSNISSVSFTRNLSIGSQGDDVTRLQTILNTAGFLKVSPTGYFGSLTETAVKAYQTAHNINSTGFVGLLTRAELSK